MFTYTEAEKWNNVTKYTSFKLSKQTIVDMPFPTVEKLYQLRACLASFDVKHFFSDVLFWVSVDAAFFFFIVTDTELNRHRRYY